jgi:hypothetical protein
MAVNRTTAKAFGLADVIRWSGGNQNSAVQPSTPAPDVLSSARGQEGG